MRRKQLLLSIVAVFVVFAGIGVAAKEYDFSPITDDILINAPNDPDNWLMYRRTYDGWGYSPLDQINVDNVSDLQIAWMWTMEPGASQEATPLVYNGVMYLHGPMDVVQALDAETGDLIWEYRRELMDRGQFVNRNPALYEDKLIIGTHDAALVALDRETGQVIWEQQVSDSITFGHGYSGGPLVLPGGVVVAGMSGCINITPGGCWISAHDADTGEELWRRYTIAREGEPGDETWGGLPIELRYGGSAWITGSYDPDLDIVYWATAVPIPWGAIQRGTDFDGDDLLYTNSILALDRLSGEIEWYHQVIPGDEWDMDTPQTPVLVDTEIDGEMRKVLVHPGGKVSIFQARDRETGEFLWATETIYQNIISDIDPETGRYIRNRELYMDQIGETKLVCPGLFGGINWQATAYSPLTNAIYTPLSQACMDYTIREFTAQVGEYHGSAINVFRHAPGNEGNLGRVDAIDVATGEHLWSYTQRAMQTGSLLTTGGGLVFGGDANRRLHAWDQFTGEVVWESILATQITGQPISYAVDGVQYIAVPVGCCAINMTSQLTPEIQRPAGGNMLVVFRLPESRLEEDAI